ncbi:hypothetical protein [Desmospora profundinema]|uniref:CHASE2 domain-containing sensor protein n=1 Tax=Desmospora profundinema TaxID=1571184 RepID=A0ABU1IRK0_9BACL|nr:hypothetical protein [Desmospora profundinema]MDR6226794.1 CHASE2 domain-containing sensor protein [Desmospora profundinema]
MNRMVSLSRWVLGLIFLSAALNGWAVILGFGAFLPTSPAAEAFLGDGYLLIMVKATELICAILLLTNTLIPLTIAVLSPLVVNIFFFHIFVDAELLPLVILLSLLWGFLFWSYRDSFQPLFKAKSKPKEWKKTSKQNPSDSFRSTGE